MAVLSHTEASGRAALLAVDGYTVALDLAAGGPGSAGRFGSRTTVRFRSEDGATFADVQPVELRSVRLDGAVLDTFDPAAGRLRLDLAAGAHELVVDAVMAYSHDGEGLVRHVDPADGCAYVYAESFLDAAPRWFACFDQPDLKAPVALSVRCPPGWTVRGNGPALRDPAGVWRLEQPAPLATYFVSLVAGPYHCLTSEHDGITLGLLARASLAAELDRDAAALFAHTARCFDELHRLFGRRYPWGEYHQAFVPDFNGGAMENAGCVTLTDRLLFRSRATEAQLVMRDNTIAHELAHMWFGDLVTMRWWDDLWLSESFAEYLGQRVCDAAGDERAWVEFGAVRKAWGYAADRRPSTHPVAGNGAPDSAAALADFDGISYAKGAAALRQLAVRLGDETFLAGLRTHIDRHAFGNATLADLLSAWASAGAEGIDEWAEAWLRRPGVDTLAADGGRLSVRPPEGHPARRSHAVTVGWYDRDGGLVHEQPVLVGESGARLDDRPAALVLPDRHDQTWAKIALPASAWAGLPHLLPRLDPVARVVGWNALRLAVADAEVAPAAALDVVCAAVPVEPDDGVLNAVLDWTQAVLASYVEPGERPGATERFANATRLALADAGPGSGRQLAALRALVAVTSDAGELTVWAAGSVPSGIELDHDLRWRIVLRQCVLGRLDASDIAREQERDSTSEGAEWAAQCRAALPDPAAKQAAWSLLMHDRDAPNSTLYATARGFWQPGQDELTAPYVERYFAEIAATAGFRSGWVVGRLAGAAYPWPAVSPATLAAGEAFLARADLTAGVRRAVVDAADDLRRAHTSRTRFT